MKNDNQKKESLEEFLNAKTGAQCGMCGCDLTYGNDAGTGFCKECQEKEDAR